MQCPNCEAELKRVQMPDEYFVEVTLKKDGKVTDRRIYDLLECPVCGLTMLLRKKERS